MSEYRGKTEKVKVHDTVDVEKLPLLERMKCYFDFDSYIKHIWLTGYILITWEADGVTFIETLKTLDFSFYSKGSYGE